jgi:3-hydroxyacyl-CoA dehydrogenase/enoyl-CoA hydratase/3-hydroxybutyryl-CoA epimerase
MTAIMPKQEQHLETEHPVAPPRTIHRTVHADGICVLTFDRPGSAANIFDRQTLRELHEELDFITDAPQIKGVILVSAKPSIFIAGADLHMMTEATPLAEARELLEYGQSLIQRLSLLPIPTVAAIHGAAVGGGYEITLACDYRLATPDRATKIGLPEVHLGLLPAWGGATRLPRLIGLPKALDVILGGKTLAAKPALKLGMVDELVAREYLVAAATQKIRQGKPRRPRSLQGVLGGLIRGRNVRPHPSPLPQERKKYFPCSDESSATGFTTPPTEKLSDPATSSLSPGERASVKHSSPPTRPSHPLLNNRLVAAIIAARLRPQLLKKTRGHYPAVLKALEVMTTGITKAIPDSLRLERDGIIELIQTDACHNLIRTFFLQERAKKLSQPSATATPHVLPKPIARTAVIGAGVMGAGIAQWLSARQFPVILRDVSIDQVAKGMGGITKLFQDGVKRHVFTEREARDGLDRIHPAPCEVPLRTTDLIIEAAVENLALKKKIFQRLDELTGADAILATNTSALPVSELAAATRHPERVLGLHFFNPVHRMQLLEIVIARQTAPEVVQRALRFAQQIGKLPVVVKDSPGFLVNRILMPYLIEAGNLFETGASTHDLDEVMLDFGMPMGPMRLLDEVGLDVGLHVAATLATAFGDRMKVPAALSRMVDTGLLGRKNGRGFYLHRKAKEPQPNPQVELFVHSLTAREFSREELQERMVFLMVNEAARCLEEQIVTDPADVDFAMIMGVGFAPFRGGPLRYADKLGTERLVGAMDHLTDCGATQFEPCALLRQMADGGKTFYH